MKGIFRANIFSEQGFRRRVISVRCIRPLKIKTYQLINIHRPYTIVDY